MAWHLLVAVSVRFWGYYLIVNRKANRERDAVKKSDDKAKDAAICDDGWPADIKYVKSNWLSPGKSRKNIAGGG